MPIYHVEVDVALSRPPKIDQIRKIVVVAGDGVEAELIGCQMVQGWPGVVMAVGSRVTDWSDDPHLHAETWLNEWVAGRGSKPSDDYQPAPRA